MSRHFRPLRALTIVVGGSLLLTLGLAGPAAADEYPSWDDVLAARQNEADTTAAIKEIEGILAQLESEASELGRAAQVKGEEYNAAVYALDAASAKATRLQDQATDAEKRAEASIRRAGQLIAQFARTGGGSVSLGLLLSPDSSDLLNSLGTMSKLTEQSSLIYQQATLDQNLAQSLTDEAKVAESQRKTLAADAQLALDAAKTSADAAVARVAEQKTASDQMYAQLAALKGTTAGVEQAYQVGLTEAAEQAAQPPPPPAPSNPPNPPPPAPNGSAVQGAIAFAYAQIGDMYLLGGSGPDRWDCSGLTKAAYASVGVYIGAHVVSSQYYTMANQGRLVPLGQIVPGDLIYYATGGSPSDGFYHVAMYVGNGQMIEAHTDRDHFMSSSEAQEYRIIDRVIAKIGS